MSLSLHELIYGTPTGGSSVDGNQHNNSTSRRSSRRHTEGEEVPRQQQQQQLQRRRRQPSIEQPPPLWDDQHDQHGDHDCYEEEDVHSRTTTLIKQEEPDDENEQDYRNKPAASTKNNKQQQQQAVRSKTKKNTTTTSSSRQQGRTTRSSNEDDAEKTDKKTRKRKKTQKTDVIDNEEHSNNHSAEASSNVNKKKKILRFDLAYNNHNPNHPVSSSSAAPHVNDEALGSSSSMGVLQQQQQQQLQVLLPPPEVLTRQTSVVDKKQNKYKYPLQKQQLEWNFMRKQWKRRKYDMRNEPDIGNAIQNQMELLQEQNKKKRKRKRKTAPPQQQQEEGEVLGSSSSSLPIAGEEEEITEEQGILNRLLQGQSQEDNDQKQQSSAKLKPEETTSSSYVETMDYWERGLLAPSNTNNNGNIQPSYEDELERLQKEALEEYENTKRKKKTRRHSLFRKRDDEKKKQKQKHNDELFTVRKAVWGAPSYQRRNLLNSIMCERNILHPSTSLLHRRQVLRATARHLLLVFDNDNDNQRWIEVLWKLKVNYALFQGPKDGNDDDNHERKSRFTQLDLLLKMHRVAGMQLLAFLTYRFPIDKRKLAAQHLLENNHNFSGTNMETIQRRAKTDLYRFLKGNSCGKLPWKYHNSSEEGGEEKGQEEQRGSVLLEPQTQYVHLAMTKPPIPIMPLDLAPFVFGPMDRYERVWHFSRIEECVSRLTIATLLQRKKNCTRREDGTRNEQLRAVMEQMVKLNQTKHSRRLARQCKLQKFEMPLTGLYASISTYGSLIGNGLLLPSAGDDDDDEDKSRADQMLEMIDQHIKNSGLQAFADLHLTFGILQMTKILPDFAVHILSRSLDYKAPFHVLQDVLEQLEGSDCLVDGPSSAFFHERVNVAELEYALYRVSTIFAQQCIDREPTSSRYHAWYLATLSACLLLCSGNRIESSSYSTKSSCKVAHKYPSFKKPIVVYDDQDDEGLQHEVRLRLPKFAELRAEVSEAFRSLAELARYQQSSRAHMAVSAFLEWHQVVALWLGESFETVPEHVCRLHRYHRRAWADQVGVVQNGDQDDKLHGLARVLEMKPDQIDAWRSFVKELGPLVCVGSDCPIGCKDCSLLLNGYSLDHELLLRRRETDRWWGKDRQTWWYEHLLSPPSPSSVENEYKIEIEAALEGAIRQGSVMDASTHGIGEPDMSEPLDWLDGLPPQSSPEAVVSAELRSELIDDRLPKPFSEYCGLKGPGNVSLCLDTASDSASEIACYKALILGQLYSVSHEGVKRCILSVIQRGWDGSKLNDVTIHCTKWLRSMGLNALFIYRQEKPEDFGQPSGRRKRKKQSQSRAR